MIIEKAQSEKLERYLRNADPFLWGVLGAPNKEDTIKDILKLLGQDVKNQSIFTAPRPTYDRILVDLLVKLHIDGIFEQIIAPQIHKRIKQEALAFLRTQWKQGRTPKLETLIDFGIYSEPLATVLDKDPDRFRTSNQPAEIFLEIVHQYREEKHYTSVKRWTVFAGLWFEEIESSIRGPLLKDK